MMRSITPESLLWIWLLVINCIAYITMSIDKSRAERRRTRHRIPEKNLFGLAAIGGALGIWVSMYTRRHKTKHRSFVVGIPLLLVLNILMYGYIFYRWFS
ncbi:MULTISPECIES: DUF1294 domain-containing protein [Paenibacillus]|uniref:DUF1294 domain-containing protein n=1 Tax=Paenibacillus TaxID=44249 RepID=UPI00036E50F5|nr:MULTISPECIES: DUF1294 domain-containing protein [Paenibacillus]